jgi:flagellar motor switch protein FliN/FliY
MTTYLECWASVAATLFSQALAGEPELADSLPKPLTAGSFGFAATLSGDEAGRFSVVLDGAIVESPLVGEGVDQRAGWKELLREVAGAAAGELLAKTGRKCKVESFEEIESENKISRAFQLQSGGRSWSILVRDEVKAPKPAPQPAALPPTPSKSPPSSASPSARAPRESAPAAAEVQPVSALRPGIDLLLDVELDASLRFGCREMPLGEILELGPGDVVQLDRHVSDPVDLVIGDKIVARGEVVLVNGNFGLRVTEVASPRKRLESIRCLF